MIEIILLGLFFIAESENDIVMTNSKRSLFPKWEWYNRYNYKGKDWWMKNVISFMGDGFHLWKAVSIIIPSYYVTLRLDVSIWYAILFFATAGLYHSLRNGSLLRKGSK